MKSNSRRPRSAAQLRPLCDDPFASVGGNSFASQKSNPCRATLISPPPSESLFLLRGVHSTHTARQHTSRASKIQRTDRLTVKRVLRDGCERPNKRDRVPFDVSDSRRQGAPKKSIAPDELARVFRTNRMNIQVINSPSSLLCLSPQQQSCSF